jgi:hypothetical protein
MLLLLTEGSESIQNDTKDYIQQQNNDHKEKGQIEEHPDS